MPIVTLDSIKNKGGGGGGGGGGHGHAHGAPGGPGGRGAPRGDSDEDEDEDDGNEYFVGGNSAQGGGSGLSVVAPTRGGPDAMAGAMRRAMELAQRQRAGDAPPPAAAGSSSSSGSGSAGSGPGARRVVKVTIYRDGFTVNDGPIRRPGVPENDAFAESLAQGYCPDELVENGKPANVELENRSHETFAESGASAAHARAAAAPAVEAFSGAGARVGEIALSAGYVITAGTEAAGQLVVDEPKATVRVQVRFPDGSREVLKFEKHHTVRHLIHRIEVGRSLARYQLLGAGRGNPKPIEPDAFDLTITDAGLAGAVVTVRDVT